MFNVGLSGAMFDSKGVWAHIKAAAEYKYSSVELRSTHVTPDLPDREQRDIRTALHDKGLGVYCLSCFVGNYGLLEDEQCVKAYDVFKQYVELAGFFDCPMVRIWPAWQDSSTAGEKVWDKAVSWMKKSGEYAAKYDKKLVMEMHHGTLCDTAESSISLLTMIGLNNVGLAFDPVNLYQVPSEYGASAIRTLGKRIFDVHVKDIVKLLSGAYPYSFPYTYYAKHVGRFTPVAHPSLKEERYYTHRRINQGGIDWCSILKALQGIDYAGHLIVESVSESNMDIPSGEDLAKACYDDLMSLQKLVFASNQAQ